MVDDRARYRYLTQYLAKQYDAPLYERGGIAHPVIFHAADESDTIESVLGSAPVQQPDDFAFYNYAYLHTLQNSGRNLFNGVTFTMQRLRTQPLKLDAHYGTYFDMLATCAALDDELRAAATHAFIRVPQRKQLHDAIGAERVLTHGDGRSATIGGAVLVVHNDAGTYKALLSRRTSQHATRPNHFHLMPAFVFQPAQRPHQPHEWNLRYHIEREWLEELFGLPENTAFDDHPALADLRAMQADGRAALHLTGIALNLLTLRPEICALLLIHDPMWWQRITATDSDIPLNTHAETDDALWHLPISSDEAALAQLPSHPHTQMPPQAVAALWAGIDLARRLTNLTGHGTNTSA